MKHPLQPVVTMLVLLTCTIGLAQTITKTEALEEVVLTATKFAQKKEHIGKVLYTITQQDIKNHPGATVASLLNMIPGIEIKGAQTNPSEPRGVFIRGGRGRQVLFLINGVPVSDASGINQEFDLRFLNVQQIARIEVLKGASSTLYGSGAATGVINIILKEATKTVVNATYEVRVGTNATSKEHNLELNETQQSLMLNGTLGRWTYQTSLSLEGVEGMSSAASKDSTPFEEDPFYKRNTFIQLGYKLNEQSQLNTFFHHDRFNYNYDGGSYTDALSNYGTQTQYRYGLNGSFKHAKGALKFTSSINTISRTDVSFGRSSFEGQSVFIDLFHKYRLTSQLELITGINLQEHRNETESPYAVINADLANYTTLDPYASLVYTHRSGWNAFAGARLNHHSLYGNYTVYDINFSKNMMFKSGMSIKWFSSYSTAFIAPSTYQLFSDYGNTNLNPETSTTFEFGSTLQFNKGLTLDLVYFNREEANAIIFEGLAMAPWGVYANAESTLKARGLETALRWQPTTNISLDLGYTYTDKTSDNFYISKHKLNTNVTLALAKQTRLGLRYMLTGERFGSFYDSTTFTVKEQQLPRYDLFDINIQHTILEGKVATFASVNNLFNTAFESVIGYATQGRTFQVGLRISL